MIRRRGVPQTHQQLNRPGIALRLYRYASVSGLQ